MVEYIGIIDGKIVDVCSNLTNSNYDPKEITYIEVSQYNQDGRCFTEDTWDDINNITLEDAPKRTAPREKTIQQLKIEELEAKLTQQGLRLKALEDK